MNQDQAEGLAEKILADAMECIRRLGFQVMVREKIGEHSHTYLSPVMADKVVVISEERFKRGDY